ncbi:MULTISPECIES: sigma-70 family RNA polymerase sigma factor [Catenuloplanes]|uniref:RNA polymerase sigma-70 factor (ECF subfamily) n=1 Tax=Catenuloplanes niger TaxID=587534 RepID=A0AAE4CVV6_9ACTN|nr:sigma-70 family RNA polymerase sigma factor [Catenuloplanes niger]MDR7325842.1 RNA polymerase sigma-70 factor (ECF subfamily) [Catenuloplanes niger]
MVNSTSSIPRKDAGDSEATGETPEAALEHLQRVHRPVLLAYVRQLVKGDLHWAEDVVQETMVRAWKNPDARMKDGRWSRGWLCTVARRIVIDNIRAAAARPAEAPDELMPEVAAAEIDLAARLDDREVRAAIAVLPERLRTVLVEIFYQERTVAEAAEVLDVPAGTVKSRTFYALRALRGALDERGYKRHDQD